MTREETQPPQPRFSAQSCGEEISKLNRKRNRRLRLNWQCNRLHIIFGQYNRLRLLRTIHPLLWPKRYHSLTLRHKLYVLCHKFLKDISPRIGYNTNARLTTSLHVLAMRSRAACWSQTST